MLTMPMLTVPMRAVRVAFTASMATGVTAFLLAGCASLVAKNEMKLNLTGDAESPFLRVPVKASSGVEPYQVDATTGQAQWLACHSEAKGAAATQATFFLAHNDRLAFDPDKFCKGWIAQAFLSEGFDVMTVNRPGYGTSTGTPDFSGAMSLAAEKAGGSAALKKAGVSGELVGVWGYGTGATAAALLAKQMTGIKFMVLGGGVYDYEDAAKTTTDDYLRKDIAQLRKTGGATAIEQRSVAYDASGFPAKIIIYHGQQDAAVPPTEAKAFADALESTGTYKVNLQLVDGLGHDIPWDQHRRLLETLLKTLAPAPPNP